MPGCSTIITQTAGESHTHHPHWPPDTTADGKSLSQQVHTESAQQLCSAFRKPSREKLIWKNSLCFSTGVPHLPHKESSGWFISPVWELTSSQFLFQSKLLEIISYAWTNYKVWKVNSTVTSQTSWFNRQLVTWENKSVWKSCGKEQWGWS